MLAAPLGHADEVHTIAMTLSLILCTIAFGIWGAAGNTLHRLGLGPSEFVRALAGATWLSFVGLYPFWILGPYSAIGWYDAYDAVIPFDLLKANGSATDFNHAFSGGTVVQSIIFLAGPPWPLYGFLIKCFGAPSATLLFQLGGMVLLFMGVYQTARLLLGVGHLASMFGGLTALFITQDAEIGTFSGLGWNYALMAWIGLLVVTPMTWPSRVAAWLALAVLASMTGTIGFLPTTAAFYVAALLIATAGRGWLGTIPRNIVPGTAFTAVLVAANWTMLQSMSAGAKESSRLLRIQNLQNLQAWAGGGGTVPPPDAAELLNSTIVAGTQTFLPGLGIVKGLHQLSGLPPTILYLAILAAGFALFPRAAWRVVAALLFLFVSGFALTFAFQALSIPYLSTFRWNTVWFSMIPVFGLAMAAILAGFDRNESLKRWRAGTYALLSAVLVISIAVLAERTLREVSHYGGWAAFGRYEESLLAAKSGQRERALTFNDTKYVLGAFNGMDVLDGGRQNFTPPRTAFWYLSLDNRALPNWHTHRHAPPAQWSDINVGMLRMANVGFVYSRTPVIAPELELVAHQEALPLRDTVGLIPARLVPGMSDLVVLPELNVYRLTGAWPRVFVAASVTTSDYAIFEAAYYRELISVSYLGLLLPRDEDGLPEPHSSLTLGTPVFTNRGMWVETAGSGVLVYNQEFTSERHARCVNGQQLRIHRANAIMMAVEVPAGCTKVAFEVSG